MALNSVYDNGGIIGQVMDFGSTEQYISGTTTPSLVGSASASGTSTLSLTGITGLSTGDLLIVFATNDTNWAPRSVTSSGWTDAVNFDEASVRGLIAYKVVGGTVDTSVTVSSTVNALTVSAWRGVSYESISSVAISSSTNEFTVDPASVSVTNNNSVVLVLSAIDDDDNTSISSAPTGYTTEVTAPATAGQNGCNAQMYKTGVSSGTEDPSTVTWATSDAVIAYTLVLSPQTSYGNFKNSGIWNLNAVYNYLTPAPLVRRNLILHLDASDTASYPGTGTTWTDLSSAGNDGTLTNGPTYTYPYIQFDGDNDYVDLGTIATSNALQLSSPADNGITISYAAWMNGPSGADDYQRIVDKSDNTLSNNGWAIYDNSTSTISSDLRFTFGNSNTTLSSGTTPTYSTWQIWTFTWNSSNGAWTWYINGSSVNSGTQTYAISNVQTNMRLATWNHSTARELNGRIGFFMVHESVLDSTEVLNNYNYYKNIYGIS